MVTVVSKCRFILVNAKILIIHVLRKMHIVVEILLSCCEYINFINLCKIEIYWNLGQCLEHMYCETRTCHYRLKVILKIVSHFVICRLNQSMLHPIEQTIELPIKSTVTMSTIYGMQ